jgi:hypothetical protein
MQARRTSRLRDALPRCSILAEMVRVVLFLLVLVATAASTAGGSTGSGKTRLAILEYPQGREGGTVRRYRLDCRPPAGTVPQPGRACSVLAGLAHPFAPVPRGEICSQLALGPQEAVVSGKVHGRRVYARLGLRDSCQIERWRRVARVVPGFPGPA